MEISIRSWKGHCESDRIASWSELARNVGI